MDKNKEEIKIEKVIKVSKNENITDLIILGELIPLVSDTFYNNIIPLEAINEILLSPSEASNILKYLELRKEKPSYLVYGYKLKPGFIQENSFGTLLKIQNIKLDKQNYAWMELSFEKTIKIIYTKIFESHEYGRVEEIKCFTDLSYSKLKKALEKTLEVVKNFYIKKRENFESLPAFNLEIPNYTNYAINLTNHLILDLYRRQKNKLQNMYILLEEKIEQRLLYIQAEFLNLTSVIPRSLEPLSPLVKQTNILPSSSYIPTIAIERYKFKEIISLFDKKLILAFWHIDTPVIDILIKLFYEGKKDIILLKDNTINYTSNDKFPAVQATIDDVKLQVNNSFFIYITPQKRVKPIEIVSYQESLYSKVEEIQPLISAEENKKNLFKELVKKVINLFQEKDSSYVPFFNQYLSSYETYAENLSFYLAEKIFLSSFEEKLYNFTQKDLYSRFEELQKILESEKGIITYTTAKEWVDAANALPNSEYEKALAYYNKALEIEFNDESALYSIATLLNYPLNRHQEALEYYNKLSTDKYAYCDDKAHAYINLKEYKQAIDYLHRISPLEKKYIYSRFYIGFSYLKLENYKEAIKYFDESIKLSEEAKTSQPKGFSEPIAYSIYFRVLEDSDTKKILKAIDKILNVNPKSKSALILRIRIFHILEKFKDSLIYCDELCKLNANCTIFMQFKALALTSLSRYEEALNYFEKSNSLGDPGELWQSIKVICLNRVGKYNEAIKECDMALADNPKCVEDLLNKADALQGLEKHEEALKLVDEILVIDPNNSHAYARQGFVYAASEKYKEALIAFDNAIEFGTKDSQSTKDVIKAKDEAFNKLRESLLEGDLDYLIDNTPLSPQAKINATQHLNSLKALDGNSEKSEHIKYLRDVIKLPWGKYDSTNIDLNKVEEALAKEHYGLKEVKDRILDSLVFMAVSPKAKPLILCLVGPSGVGKTSIANIIAKALERKCVTISLAGANDANLIRGCMTFYRGATPSKVLLSISNIGSCNPVMILDEIDKIDLIRGNNIEDALLQLIDPSQNSNFTDDYFDFAFDLSKVFFVITANSLKKVSEPLRNRMEIIEIKEYTESEKLEISKNYILPKILDEVNLTISDFKISADMLKYIIKNYTNEPGVREIERLLRKIVQKYLRAKLKKEKNVMSIDLIKKYLSSSSYNIAKFGF